MTFYILTKPQWNKKQKTLKLYKSKQKGFGNLTWKQTTFSNLQFCLKSGTTQWTKSWNLNKKFQNFYLMTYTLMIKNAIKNKIVKDIEKGKFFQNLIRRFDKLAICWLLFLVCFYGKSWTFEFLKQYRSIVYGGIFINLFWFFDTILSGISKFWQIIPKFELEKPETKDHLDGFNKSNLIDFLIKKNWFPFMDAKKQFWISPQDFKKIGDNLERVGILTRGENNARILKQWVTPELLQKIFNCENSDDLFPPLLRNWNSIEVQNI